MNDDKNNNSNDGESSFMRGMRRGVAKAGAPLDQKLMELRATKKMRQSVWHSHFYLPGLIPPSEEVLSWPSRLSPMKSGLCCNP